MLYINTVETNHGGVYNFKFNATGRRQFLYIQTSHVDRFLDTSSVRGQKTFWGVGG